MPSKKTPAKNPNRVASMNANRLVTINLRMRHMVNGKVYGPGEVKLPFNLATGLAHTEGHAAIVEEQFQGAKAAIIGPRRPGGVTVKQVPTETFDTEYANAQPATQISGANMGDGGGGNRF